VKVSRSDWLGDQKWNAYIPLCHRFSIAAAHGVVHDGEVPAGIGWYEYNPATKTLRIKQKVVHRDIEPDANMLMYIIMSKIQSDRIPFHADRAALFRDYVEGKREARYIGRALSHHMQQRLERADKIEAVYKATTEEQAKAAKAVEDIKQIVRARGGFAYHTDELAAEIEKLLAGEPNARLARAIQSLRGGVEELALLTGQAKLDMAK
jgi:hypothetical protein